MKKLNLFALVIISFYLLTSCNDNNSVDPIEEYVSNYSDGLSNEYITNLNEIITPLKSCFPTSSVEDLEPLNSLGNAQIVGLGEATHGTKEFFQLKHKIFRYLVENHGFKIFAFECDMGESVYIDRYITKGEGSLDDIMLNKMHFWTWQTKEVAALISWMKEYNDSRGEGDKIHLIGDDCQLLTFQADLIKDFVKNISNNRAKLDELIKYINDIPRHERRDAIISKNGIEITNLYSLIGEAEAELEQHMQKLVSDYNEFEYEIHQRLLINIKQTVQAMRDASYNYRDLYMAKNTLWCTELFNGSKVALWAHNGHVAKDNSYGSGSQGYHIKENIGDKYKVVGFSFSKGQFNAIGYTKSQGNVLGIQNVVKSPLEGSLNEIFYNAKMDNFIVDFSNLQTNSSLYDFCKSKHRFFMVGSSYNNNPNAYYRELEVGVHYDFIINYDFTSAAIPY